MNDSIFFKAANFYEIAYVGKSYNTECDYIGSCVDRYCVFPEKETSLQVLDLGCGTGSHDEILASKYGYQITGVDLSPRMIEIARKKAIPNFEGIVGDIRNFEVKRSYDVVISMFHVLSYITSMDDLVNVFKRVGNALLTGGIFIFDTWYTPGVLTEKPEVRIREFTFEGSDFLRIAVPENNYHNSVVNVNYSWIQVNGEKGGGSVFSEVHSMRYFSFSEINYLADIAGFDLVEMSDFFNKVSEKDTPWAVTYVLRKK